MKVQKKLLILGLFIFSSLQLFAKPQIRLTASQEQYFEEAEETGLLPSKNGIYPVRLTVTIDSNDRTIYVKVYRSQSQDGPFSLIIDSMQPNEEYFDLYDSEPMEPGIKYYYIAVIGKQDLQTATAEQKSEPVIKEKTIETDTKLDVNVVEILYGTPKGILEQCEKREKAQSKEDEEFKEASNIKNSLEQYIYNARDKLDNLLKGYYTVEERKKLEGLMSQLMDWLYSDDTENLYNKSVLLQNSKEMSLLGDAIFRRESQWTRLRKDFEIGAQTLNELKAAAGAEKEKIAKKETCYLTEEDFGKIGKYLEEAERSLREKIKTSEGGLMVQEPNVNPDDVEGLVKNLRENVKKVYDDAEFKVKEAERKRKEEEEKKRKEEEEKKKKEEEEKKKKEGDKKEAGKEKEGKDEKKEEGPKDNKEQQPQPGTTKMDVE